MESLENMLEVKEHTEEGYKSLISFESWRVAIANHGEKNDKDKLKYIERHMQTDEVFVLLAGEGSLLIGKEMEEVPLSPYKLYNVKKATWHALCLSEDAKVLIVENSDTSRENTEYYYLNGENQ